ncbi:chloride channel 7 [Thecamonas trahens ATCC 50062]|uniref:Chloride channel protein n=1 Tax=Thecamonas trahens ATCC 50062 TaxID=461836 RepID=A0A0L0D9Y4_THETB|nr:chloride channel 7 [Thecamonas trahens ATCC 50062]KNC49172.1 chloride channel 7 [Thecamonas trahens ATCC 50062]|eukprot:XP_013758192.1 chloride channel 7 [Thecamonas trahens ATCC 50062]
MTAAEVARMNSYESLDYEVWYSEAQEAFEEENQGAKGYAWFMAVMPWLAMFAIGLATGIVSFGIFQAVKNLAATRFALTFWMLDHVSLGAAFAAYAAWAGVSVGIASLLVMGIEPVAGGSGIPEIKGYLNGTNVHKLMRLKTAVVKVLGVIFAVSGGLTCGKEGPLVHTGFALAGNIVHLPKMATACATRASRKYWQAFRSDVHKRDFVTAGAAAGVAAAFGAPVGGVLFALEEASSYWQLQLMWRSFFCALIATFTLIFFRSGSEGSWLDLSSPGLITFGEFKPNAYRLWELIPFLGLAVCNNALCRWRRDHIEKAATIRVLEAVAIAVLTAALSFWLPVALQSCKELPARLSVDDAEHYHRFLCKPGEYSAMANAMFNTQEDIIKGFFHIEDPYPIPVLLIVLALYFGLATITYGLAVPAGLFVPAIMCGCAYGRMAGEAMDSLFPSADIDSGVYALIGAATALGGITRMTISLTVILLETTNDIQMLLPLMVGVIVSKWVGDWFNISLYDLHVELKCIPFVENNPPAGLERLTARDIMVTPLVTLPHLVTVGAVYDVLVSTSHNGFPVVAHRASAPAPQQLLAPPSSPSSSDPRLVGIILRSHLLSLLRHRTFYHELDGPDGSPVLDLAQDASIPHVLDFAPSLSSTSDALATDLAGVALRPGDRDAFIDLRPFLNKAPFRVLLETPVPRVYRTFRSMGLRHLCVVDENNTPHGIITRKDIRTDFTVDLN